jgi:tetratricopeptide (TPR) repeat protein
MSEPSRATRRRPVPQYAPPRNGPCLCGSGLKYKRCCADHLPGHEQQGSRTRDLLAKKKFKEALLSGRADVTQYTIWHKSHTEPAVRAGMAKEGSILEIDIRALADYVEQLMYCHAKADMADEIPAVLDRLRSNINDPDWQRKITYLQAIHAIGPNWDREAGRRELKRLGSVAEDKDEEILALYLDLFGDNLSFSERLELVDRILTHSQEFSNRLHYRGTKAVLFLIIGDDGKAESELSAAVEEVRERRKEGPLGEYERHRFAQTLELLGALREDDTLLNEALQLYQELLKEEAFTSVGRANLHGLIGDTHRKKHEWAKARDSYLQALAIASIPIHRIFLAECFLQLDQLDEALKTFGEVKCDELQEPEQVDYAFTLSMLAIETGEQQRLESAKTLLKDLPLNDPLFRQQRDAILLNVQEALASGASRSLVQRNRRLFARIAGFLTTYLVLKPSFMGMGVDVGKILENYAKRGEGQAKDRDCKASQAKPKRPTN